MSLLVTSKLKGSLTLRKGPSGSDQSSQGGPSAAMAMSGIVAGPSAQPSSIAAPAAMGPPSFVPIPGAATGQPPNVAAATGETSLPADTFLHHHSDDIPPSSPSITAQSLTLPVGTSPRLPSSSIMSLSTGMPSSASELSGSICPYHKHGFSAMESHLSEPSPASTSSKHCTTQAAMEGLSKELQGIHSVMRDESRNIYRILENVTLPNVTTPRHTVQNTAEDWITRACGIFQTEEPDINPEAKVTITDLFNDNVARARAYALIQDSQT
jgi:hypothetical protein